jgi:hypothetical protein
MSNRIGHLRIRSIRLKNSNCKILIPKGNSSIIQPFDILNEKEARTYYVLSHLIKHYKEIDYVIAVTGWHDQSVTVNYSTDDYLKKAFAAYAIHEMMINN